jgi:hypothetical protein
VSDETVSEARAINRTRSGRFAEGASGNPPTKFEPGRSGNPAGRPPSLAATVRSQVGGDGEALIAELLKIARRRGGGAWGKVQAIRELLDRGWGRAPALIAHVDITSPAASPLWDTSRLSEAELELLTGLVAKLEGVDPSHDAPRVTFEGLETVGASGRRRRVLLEWPPQTLALSAGPAVTDRR